MKVLRKITGWSFTPQTLPSTWQEAPYELTFLEKHHGTSAQWYQYTGMARSIFVERKEVFVAFYWSQSVMHLEARRIVPVRITDKPEN
jgi:hypothetical protein